MVQQFPRVALITGAGSGIGRATAILLASKGFTVAITGRRSEPLAQTASLLPAAAVHLEIVADVGEHDGAAAMVDRTVDTFGRLDVLINNAGFAPLLSVEAHTPELLEECYRVNALGPAYTIARAWPVFKKQQAGCIVNVSTLGTIDPFEGFFGYAASKAAVNLMAMSCAKEGRALGVRAFAVAPGAVETPMLRAIFPESKLPRSSSMPPERIARVILECVEGGRDAQNGQVIVVNDGAVGSHS